MLSATSPCLTRLPASGRRWWISRYTLGWLLVQNGEINRGLALLQEARVKAPHIPDIHFHMAVALYKSGRVGESRKELDRLLRTGKTFPELDEARALHEQLSLP